MGTEQKKTSLLGSVSFVMVIMIFSRLLALLSTQIYISVFGTEGNINIYSYAITIPNTIFNCIGTALSTVVIPIYAGHLAKGEHEAARKFADNIITVATVLTAGLVLIGMGLAFVLPLLTEFRHEPQYSFAVRALMIMMPVMLFTGLNYILQGILQSHGHYGFPAFVSVPSSLVVIGYVLFFVDKAEPEKNVPGLLIATFIGLALQALILIPPAIAAGYRYKPSFGFTDPDILKAGKMALPVLLGVSAYQLNMFFNTTMIAGFGNMVTVMTYVQNLVLYMVLAFVYSITAVVYPKLTESAAAGKMDEYKDTLSGVLKTTLALLIPITFGLIAVRYPLLDLIAGWGKFSENDVATASRIMLLYAIGIVGIGLKEILDRAFYAVNDTKTPALVGVIIMGVNVLLGLGIVFYFKTTATPDNGAFGIPFAYSVASLTGLAVSLILLRRKVGRIGGGLLSDALKCLVSGIVMGGAVIGLRVLTEKVFAGGGVFLKLVRLGVPVIAGILIYAALAVIFRVSAAEPVMRKMKRNQ